MTTEAPAGQRVRLPDRDAVKEHLAVHAPCGRALIRLTAEMGPQLHHVVVDRAAGTVWSCRKDPDSGGEWVVEGISPQQAADFYGPYVDAVQGQIDASGQADDPGWTSDTFEAKQGVVDDFVEILLMGLPSAPREAADAIQLLQAGLRREVSLWSRTYAAMVRELVGDARGGKAAAARELGVSEVQIGRILREDAARRAQHGDPGSTRRTTR